MKYEKVPIYSFTIHYYRLNEFVVSNYNGIIATTYVRLQYSYVETL